jgi:hypothetical protein
MDKSNPYEEGHQDDDEACLGRNLFTQCLFLRGKQPQTHSGEDGLGPALHSEFAQNMMDVGLDPFDRAFPHPKSRREITPNAVAYSSNCFYTLTGTYFSCK